MHSRVRLDAVTAEDQAAIALGGPARRRTDLRSCSATRAKASRSRAASVVPSPCRWAGGTPSDRRVSGLQDSTGASRLVARLTCSNEFRLESSRNRSRSSLRRLSRSVHFALSIGAGFRHWSASSLPPRRSLSPNSARREPHDVVPYGPRGGIAGGAVWSSLSRSRGCLGTRRRRRDTGPSFLQLADVEPRARLDGSLEDAR